MKQPVVSVVLGSYNRRSFLKATLKSVRNNGMSFPYEIIVVDGGSTDGSLNYLIAQKDVVTVIQHNRGQFRGKRIERRSWGYFMNLGFKAAQGKYILMISDDCLLIPSAIENGVKGFERLVADGRKVGAMAFYWRDWPGSDTYWVGKTFGRVFVNHGLYLREVAAALNGFDEESYHFYHADGDLCLRMWREGYEVVDCPDAYVEHFSHASPRVRASNAEHERADWEAYSKRWGDLPHDTGSPLIERAYLDHHRTYRKFPWQARALLAVKELANSFLRRLGNRDS